MNEYTELASMLIDKPDTEVMLELNVAESSLRRGLKTALKELKEVRAIMNLPDLTGSISIKRGKQPDTYLVAYVTTTAKPNVRFTIIPITNEDDAPSGGEDY